MTFAFWRDRLLLALLALLPWQARFIKQPAALDGVPWEQGTAALFLTELLLLGALICHVLAPPECRVRRDPAPTSLRLAAIFVAYAFLSIFWGYDTVAGVVSWVRLAEGFALATLLWSSALSPRRALAAFLAGAAATSALGIVQVATQSSFASSLLGVASHLPHEAGVAVIETAGGRFLRAYGSLPHPNVLGGFAAAGLIAAAALRLGTDRPRDRALLALAGGLTAGGLLLSFSRSAWISVLAVSVCALADRGVRAAVRKRLASWLAVGGVGLIAAALILWPLLASRLGGDGRLERRSVDDRTASVMRGVSIFLRDPAIGTGVGNFLPVAWLDASPPSDAWSLHPPHLVPLAAAAELGFFGAAVLLAVIWAWHAEARESREGSSEDLRLAALLPLVVIVVGLFDHYPYSYYAGTMLTGALYGLALKLRPAPGPDTWDA